jgi:hypothetical protein
MRDSHLQNQSSNEVRLERFNGKDLPSKIQSKKQKKSKKSGWKGSTGKTRRAKYEVKSRGKEKGGG